jgi:glycosyltransferase involved in cell wall biosynthesis
MPFEINGKIENKVLLHYVPHGINHKIFHPIPKDDSLLKKRRKDVFGEKNFNYVLFYNSRNVQRKRTSNIILAFRTFCDNLSKEESDKCCMIMHTEIRQEAGTDLLAVKEAFCPNNNILFSTGRVSPEEMNLLYNVADVTINASSSEGFGLSTAESIMAGTPIIVAVTGGLQDQIGQTKDDGSPIEFDLNFGSNNIGKYKKHGVWAYAAWPVTRCVQGSCMTPYIMDDLVDFSALADGMMYWYLMSPEKRRECGLKGREWALTDIGGINSANMCSQFIKSMDFVFDHWRPIKQFGIYTEKDYIGNFMPHNSLGFEMPVIDKEKIKNEIRENIKK